MTLVYLTKKIKIIQQLIIIQIQMVKIEHLTKLDKSDTQSLDLSSTHSDKIRKIQGLERFNQLLSLNLSNNMIIKIENISCLSHLRVLNLDFNQISKIEGLQSLNQLQQLSLSYNCITTIPHQIETNQAIRVLQMSYNDLKSIEDIRALSGLRSLSILSLAGNPFLTTLNYLSFIKMLVPSLLLLDSKDTTQALISAHVHPQQEILILRDALNKLIDERNSRSQVEQTQQQTKTPKPFDNSAGRSAIRSLDPSQQRHRHSFGRSISFGGNDREQLLELLEEWIGANSNKIEIKRIEISQLSEDYSRRISESGLKHEFTARYHQLQEKIRRYRELQSTGILQTQKRQKLMKMERQVKEIQETEEAKREESRLTLNGLKGKESEYCKLKQKNSLLQSLKSKIEANPVLDPHKLFLSQILFGHQSYDLNYKQIKKYLVYPKGLIEIIRTLNIIIFGEAADYDRILRLKEFLGSRSLIEIVNNLKELGLGYKKEMKKYQKQKNKIIQKLETEALELCQEWRQVQKQKQSLRRSRQSPSPAKQTIVQERYYSIETEERNRIMQLKKEKDHYDSKIEDLKKSLENLQNQFERKYKQLQEFQHFFQQFKSDKEIANGLKQQMEQTQQMISNKQMILTQIDQNIKDLSYKQETLQERAAHFERKAFEKSQEFNHYEQKLKAINDKIKKGNEQFNLKSFDFVRIQQQFNKLLQENRQYEKKIERHRNTYELFQQKLKNLNEIETNKKNTLASIEAQLQSQKKRLQEIQVKVEQSQQKLNRNMQMSYQYQLKIQEGKKSIQSLSDINRTLSDMLQRQNQLKRANLQLQLENQHLIELKSKLIQQIKDKYDDQDENL